MTARSSIGVALAAALLAAPLLVACGGAGSTAPSGGVSTTAPASTSAVETDTGDPSVGVPSPSAMPSPSDVPKVPSQ